MPCYRPYHATGHTLRQHGPALSGSLAVGWQLSNDDASAIPIDHCDSDTGAAAGTEGLICKTPTAGAADSIHTTRADGSDGLIYESGVDKRGWPIVIIRPRLELARRIPSNADDVRREVVGVLEGALRETGASKQNKRARSVLVVVDYSDFKSWHMSSTAEFICLDVLHSSYPGLLGEVFVLQSRHPNEAIPAIAASRRAGGRGGIVCWLLSPPVTQR